MACCCWRLLDYAAHSVDDASTYFTLPFNIRFWDPAEIGWNHGSYIFVFRLTRLVKSASVLTECSLLLYIGQVITREGVTLADQS